MRSIETQSEELDDLHIMIEGYDCSCVRGFGGHGLEASRISAAVLRGRDKGRLS